MATKQIGLAREAWGPRFWSILHRLAELSGNQKVDIMVNDEAEAWIVFLKAQTLIMPCITCKDHYQEWLNNHRPERIRFLFGEERRGWLRHWLWGCHDRVNQLTNKSSPPEESLTMLYEKRSIQKEIVELGMMFQLALSKGVLKHDDIVRWKHAVSRIRTMTGI